MSGILTSTQALSLAGSLPPEQLRTMLGSMETVTGRVMGAVFNSDLYKKKEELLKTDPEGIVAGLTAYIRLTGAKGAVLVAEPDAETEKKLLEAAKAAGISLTIEKEEMVLRTAHREDCFVPLDMLRNAALILEGEKPGVLLSVCGKENQPGALFEADPEEGLIPAILSHAPQEAGEASAWKAILCDHTFYTMAQAEKMAVRDLPCRSGVIRILGQKDCVADTAYRELAALREKSCGRCTFCREGLVQLTGRIGQAVQARAKGPEMDLAGEIAKAMRISFHCSLGEDAPMPVLSLLEGFQDELEAHIRRGECPAGVCRAYCNYYIDPKACTGAGRCIVKCPADAIEQKSGYTSVIDTFACTRCGACLEACPEQAVHFVFGKVPRNMQSAQRLKKQAESSAAADEASGIPEGSAEEPKKDKSAKRRRTFAKPVKK